MQPYKSKRKIEQIEKIATNSNQITQSISDVIDKFNVKSVFKGTDIIKRSGILVSTIAMALLVIPFYGAVSISAIFKSGLNNPEAGMKDTYYDLKNNPKINWRLLLLSMAKRFEFLVSKSKDEVKEIKKQIKAMIFDDTTLEKTGKKTESIGYVFDHTQQIHVLGYKLLVCGFWDGISFIPLDFSLHKEKRDGKLKAVEKRLLKKKEKIKKIEAALQEQKEKKNSKVQLLKKYQTLHPTQGGKTIENVMKQKQRVVDRIESRISQLSEELLQRKQEGQYLANEYFETKSTRNYCGLKKKEYNNQYKKKRDRNTVGYKRIKEVESSKIDSTIKMFKRAVRNGFIPDYVLTDTWFFCKKILIAINEAGKSIKLVSMAKIGTARYKILPTGKFLNPKEIITRYERKQGKISRKYKAKYIQFQAEYQGVRVQIFLIKFGTHSRWRMLVSTDLDISFSKIMEVYKIRWTIEVFFKESKQYLYLGKSQSQDFDAQIADATLSLMRYLLLSYYERTRYGITIGGLFRELAQASIQQNLLADISEHFLELLKIFVDFAGIDFITFYQELLRNPKAAQIIDLLNIRSLFAKHAV